MNFSKKEFSIKAGPNVPLYLPRKNQYPAAQLDLIERMFVSVVKIDF